MIPEGGDHVPSDFLAIRIPEPPDPVIHKPLLIHVKTAIPAAFCIMRLGIFLMIRAGDWGSVVEADDEAGIPSSTGARYPSAVKVKQVSKTAFEGKVKAAGF